MQQPEPFVREAGAGPGVVCIHANASASGQWRDLMDLLSPRFHVLAPDLYGSGKSPEWPSASEIRLLDEVELIEPAPKGSSTTGWSPGAGTRRRISASPRSGAAVANVRRWGHALFSEPTPLAAFARLDMPVLYMLGKRSTPAAHGVARLLASMLPRVELVQFEALGHMGPVTHPAVVNEAICAFLERA